MNIAFDIFIRHPELTSIANSIPEIDATLNKLLEFVKGRLMPLSDIIDAEEDANEEGSRCSIIYLQPPQDKPNMFLQFAGYSKDLSEKMASCFEPNDIEFIEKQLLFILDSWQQ